MNEGWIGVDLDGTLAHYETWTDGEIGAPIPLMLARVKAWLAEGKTVKIVTARVCHIHLGLVMDTALIQEAFQQREKIKSWCIEHIGQALPITAVKDFGMVELWDDRAVTVEKNTGRSLVGGRE